MQSIKHILFRILPIITLVCFLSLGITHLFNNENLTYIEIQYIDKETYIIYENPTEQQKENSYKIYEFNVQNYANNIDQDILKRSITKTIDFDAYQWTIDQFDRIWQDGYQLFDVSKTIANGVVLTINTIILPINILLVPLRITAGILLTGMSLVGININNGTFIAPFLNFIVDKTAIPFINMQNAENYQFYENINERYIGDQTIYIEFQCGEAIYDAIKIEQYSGSHIKLSYHTKNGNNLDWANVFDSGRTGNPWWQGHYNTYSKLNISNMQNKTQEEQEIITTFLTNYGQILN